MILFFSFLMIVSVLAMYQNGMFMEDLVEWIVFSSVLLFASAVDYQEQIIPDSAVFLLVINRAVYVFAFSSHPAETILLCVFNGLMNSLVVFITAVFLSFKLKKPSMGFGDVKLLFATGMYYAFSENQIIMIISCFSCIAAFFAMKKKEKLPFAPFITLGCLLVKLYISLWSV